MSLQESFGSELLQREAIRAKPVAERAQSRAPAVDRSAARMTLTARSEPYNRNGSHAKWITDGAESFDHR
jgi:hypothetical protein